MQAGCYTDVLKGRSVRKKPLIQKSKLVSGNNNEVAVTSAWRFSPGLCSWPPAPAACGRSWRASALTAGGCSPGRSQQRWCRQSDPQGHTVLELQERHTLTLKHTTLSPWQRCLLWMFMLMVRSFPTLTVRWWRQRWNVELIVLILKYESETLDLLMLKCHTYTIFIRR